MLIFSFSLFLLIMLLIGLLASYNAKRTSSDYILASRSIGPFATALSAVSTCHSGFMFIGMIGFTYTVGISAIWMLFGWIIGDYLAWVFIYPKLREQTEKKESLTLSQFVTSHLPKAKQFSTQSFLSIITFTFVSFYAAAQLIAGSKALTIFLNTSNLFGILLGAVVVLMYSVLGGIRASIWTDVVQSFIMLFAMLGLLVTIIIKIGGVAQLFYQLNAIDPSLTDVFLNMDYKFFLYVLGWCAFGLGVIGQPHILTRPMSISSPSHLKQSRWIYFSWYMVFSLAALFVGLAARVLLPELINSDAELALPLLALDSLPTFFVGIILAGIFSACISTADSQILVCSSTLTQTFFASKKSVNLSKLFTFMSLIFVAVLAATASESVFFLVIFSWSVLALIFSPLIISQIYKRYLKSSAIFILSIISFIVIFTWTYILGLSHFVNEVLPGFIILFLIYLFFKKWVLINNA